MKTFFSEDHRRHFPQAELSGGQFVTPYERPSRVEYVLARLKERGMTDIVAPAAPDMAAIRALCAPDYLDFLENAWAEWKAEGMAGEIIAANFPARRMQAGRPPRNIDGKVGYYALASETAMTGGTWAAALSSAASAQAAQAHVAGGAKSAFALCRPPGHHATADMYGGYCFINNAAAAAQYLIDEGAERISILDVDYHAGNGTQEIFYGSAVLFVALIGGSGLSTAGGIKFYRIGALTTLAGTELRRLIYPHSVRESRFGSVPYSLDMMKAILSSLFVALLTVTVAMVLLATGLPNFESAVTAAIAAFSNLAGGART